MQINVDLSENIEGREMSDFFNLLFHIWNFV